LTIQKQKITQESDSRNIIVLIYFSLHFVIILSFFFFVLWKSSLRNHRHGMVLTDMGALVLTPPRLLNDLFFLHQNVVAHAKHPKLKQQPPRNQKPFMGTTELLCHLWTSPGEIE
jgi:hypothetical protein